MSRYSEHPVVKHGDIITGARRSGTSRVTLLDAGPHSQPHAALIPEASVIQSASYPAIEGPSATLSAGEVVHVEHYGPHKIVSDRNNPDWPRLVPQYGPRYYVDFQGFGQWTIRDRKDDGNAASAWYEARAALGVDQIKSLDQAQAVAALMSAWPIILDDRWRPTP